MTQSNVRTQQRIDRKRNASSNAKARTQSNERPTIVLKTIIDDMTRDNKREYDAKKIRARLRATPTMREIHTHNASWIFTRSQYDIVRSMFDEAYAQRIARANKRASNAQRKARTQSRDDAQTNVVTNDASE